MPSTWPCGKRRRRGSCASDFVGQAAWPAFFAWAAGGAGRRGRLPHRSARTPPVFVLMFLMSLSSPWELAPPMPSLQDVADAVVRRAQRQGHVVPRDIRGELKLAGLPEEKWKEVTALA